MKFATSLSLSFCLFAAPAFSQSTATTTSKTEIRKVVEEFRTSLIAKDKVRFLKLFLGESIPWVGVMDDASLKKIRAKHPDTPRADPLHGPRLGPVPFIEGLAAEKESVEEKFSNIRIDTDGLVASVSFNYSFHMDKVKCNWGQEAWQLVKTDQGWKINSVIYSVTLNPEMNMDHGQ